MPTKWLKKRPNGSKNVLGIGFEGPGVDSTHQVCLFLSNPPHSHTRSLLRAIFLTRSPSPSPSFSKATAFRQGRFLLSLQCKVAVKGGTVGVEDLARLEAHAIKWMDSKAGKLPLSRIHIQRVNLSYSGVTLNVA